MKIPGYLKWFLVFPFAFSLFYCFHSNFVCDYAGYDLHLHWINTKNIFTGLDIYDKSVHETISAEANSQNPPKPYDLSPRFPPSCYAILGPLTLLSWTEARGSWLVINLLLTFLLAWEISRSFCSGKYFILIGTVLVCSIPWRENCFWGQNSIWSLYFFVLALRLDVQKNVLSGLALALSWFKYSLTGPLCLYILIHKRSWKSIAVAIGVHGIVLFSFSMYLHKSILYLFLAPLRWDISGNRLVDDGFDLFRFWALLQGKPDWTPFLLSGILLIGLILFLLKKGGGDDLGALALTAMVTTILTYHSFHDYIVFILGVAWFLVDKKKDIPSVLAASGIFFTCCFKHYYFSLDYLHPPQGQLKNMLRTAVGPLPWRLNGLHSIGISLVWYFSIGFLAYKLNKSQESHRQNSKQNL